LVLRVPGIASAVDGRIDGKHRSQLDVVALVQRDHETLRRASERCVRLHDGPFVRAFRVFEDRLVRHEVAEDVVIVPAVQAMIADAAVMDALENEQRRILALVRDIERQDAATEEFRFGLDALRMQLVAHLAFEEAEMVPVLASLPLGERRELGRRCIDVAGAGPSRKPPALSRSTVVGWASSLAGWLRDSEGGGGMRCAPTTPR
jgi:hypothetical protein